MRLALPFPVTLAFGALALVPWLQPAPAAAQMSDADLMAAISAAEADPNPGTHLQAADAARLMRDYATAEEHLEAAWQAAGPVLNGLINSAIMLELASGGGAIGAQREFRSFRETFNFDPITISNIAGNFPEILESGEFDEMMLRMSPDADDPAYRCGCYNTVGWVHRLRGDDEEARRSWDAAIPSQVEAADAMTNPDQEAQARGQLARNLARAGRMDEAREQLRLSKSLEVSDAARPAVQRRWAQAHAELGEVEGVVENIEPLLEANSLITVHTLESRTAWDIVRDEPAFQAMLDRHR